jgi:RNA polymerase sigma-70 factor (ECF subfamily)
LQGADSDRADIGSAGAGSERAFLALVDRYHASLTRVAGLWLDDPSEVDAVVQETWVRMLQRLEPFDQQSSLKGWLCATLIRLVRMRVDESRDPKLEPAGSDAVVPAVDPDRFSPEGNRWEGHWQKPPSDWASVTEGHVSARALQRVIEGAIDALSRSQRIIVVLRDVEGLSCHEVQSALGSSAEDQRILLHQARSRIRAVLERHHLERATHMPAAEVESLP